MNNRLKDLIHDNDEQLNKINDMLSSANKKIVMVNTALYIDLVKNMPLDDLCFEFSNRIGNETGEFEWNMYHFGRSKIEDLLIQKYRYEKETELEDSNDR